MNRGIETFFREAFDGLCETDGLDVRLFKGAGESKSDELVLWNLPRTGRLAQSLGTALNRNAYIIEQLSTFPSMVRAIRRKKPEIIFYSDSNLGFQLYRWRKQIGVPFRLLFSNGGPCHAPFDRTDYVHQIAPPYYSEALAAGESPERHRMVPYGINVPRGSPDLSEACKKELRMKLNLPVDRPIVLTVGWISATHKRMDYVIREVAAMDAQQRPGFPSVKAKVEATGGVPPFLVMLGAMDHGSEAIVALAREKLGERNFTARSVPYEDVPDYYGAADLFVLASLKEGFGRVFLEALIHGLPVIAHDHPVMRYVLGDEGVFGDLAKDGELANLLEEQLESPITAEASARRREVVRERFSWPVLAPQYRDMFFDCFEKVKPS